MAVSLLGNAGEGLCVCMYTGWWRYKKTGACRGREIEGNKGVV